MRRIFSPSDILGDITTPKKRGSISSAMIDEMVAVVDFIDLAEGEYNLILSEGSNGWWQCSCPFPGHRDSSPSFGIQAESKTFNCFGCSRSGGILEFIKIMEGLSFPESVARLSAVSGIGMDSEQSDVFRSVRNIQIMTDEYLNRHAKTGLPGGMSDVQFALTLAERLRAFENKVGAKVNGDENLIWVDGVYKEVDALLQAEDHKALSCLWRGLGVQMKERVISHLEVVE